MTKKSRQKHKYLENKKNFWGEIKSIFKEISNAKNCLRLESAPLILSFYVRTKGKVRTREVEKTFWVIYTMNFHELHAKHTLLLNKIPTYGTQNPASIIKKSCIQTELSKKEYFEDISILFLETGNQIFIKTFEITPHSVCIIFPSWS